MKHTNPVMAGAIGAAVGGALGVASAFVLRNDRARETVEEVVKTVGQKAGEYAEIMKEDAAVELSAKVDETAKDVKRVVGDK